MSSHDVVVVCENKGNGEREITIGDVVYLLDTYDLDEMITALQTVKNVAYSKVIRGMKRKP